MSVGIQEPRVPARPLRVLRGAPTLDRDTARRLTGLRSFTVHAELVHGAGDEGVVLAHGDAAGGYAAYVVDDRVRLVWNDRGRVHDLPGGLLAPGAHTLVVEVTWRPALRADVRLLVDAEDRARLDGVAVLGGRLPRRGIDVGAATHDVHPELRRRRGDFAYAGLLTHATWEPGELGEHDPDRVVDLALEALLPD